MKTYVWATNKFLSGWGMADGKIHKEIVECENEDQAWLILEGFRSAKNEFCHISYGYKKPYFRPSRYTNTYSPAKKWSRFLPF